MHMDCMYEGSNAGKRSEKVKALFDKTTKLAWKQFDRFKKCMETGTAFFGPSAMRNGAEITAYVGADRKLRIDCSHVGCPNRKYDQCLAEGPITIPKGLSDALEKKSGPGPGMPSAGLYSILLEILKEFI